MIINQDTNWNGATQLPFYKVFGGGDLETIEDVIFNYLILNLFYFNLKRFAFLSKEGIDLLQNMLHLDPNKRISAQDALNHPYFKIDPQPATIEEIEKIINLDYI